MMGQRSFLSILTITILLRFCFGKVVQTTFGKIQGVEIECCDKFLGVPYARPPERWRPSIEPFPWNNTLNTNAVKPMCLQPHCDSPPGVCLPEVSEDCLYLNIFAPRNASDLAVMVWIHGGAFDSYTAGGEIYNGEIFVTGHDVILVTINYRLGAMGFLVTGDDDDAATGNYGLMDQRLALKWVYTNIAKFGGDPEKITIFGQSAGAQSVAVHLTSGKVEPYFKQAIIQSAPFTIPFKTKAEAAKQGALFSNLAGCAPSNMTCLRRKTPEELVTAQQNTPRVYADSYLVGFEPWLPHVDGDEVPRSLLDAFTSGRFSPKPTILGTVLDDGLSYLYGLFSQPVNMIEFLAFLIQTKPDRAMDIFFQYPTSNITDTRPEIAQLVTDFVFACSTRAVARSLMNSTDVWMYIFNHTISIRESWGDNHNCFDKACHAVDIPFVFQTVTRGGFSFTDEEELISNSMLFYWTTFAKTGAPGGSSTSGYDIWPNYTSKDNGTHITMEFGAPNSLKENLFDETCNFFRPTDYYLR